MLTDPDYISLIKDAIQNAKCDACNLSEISLTWVFLKCKIRTESITYAIYKQRKGGKDLKKLTDRLSYLETLVSSTATI